MAEARRAASILYHVTYIFLSGKFNLCRAAQALGDPGAAVVASWLSAECTSLTELGVHNNEVQPSHRSK